VEDNMKRAAANDPASICMLANSYQRGIAGFPQDHVKAIELYARAVELGSSAAHCSLCCFLSLLVMLMIFEVGIL
jgi:TPR repeat protein